MKVISDEKRDKILKIFFEEFLNDTVEPKQEVKGGLGQFIGVGKLKKPTDHFDKGVNEVTIRSAHITNENLPKQTKWDITFSELKMFRNMFNKVIREWK